MKSKELASAYAPAMQASEQAGVPPLAQIAREWGRIGCVGFGGPPAHIALLRELCVLRHGWLSEAQFERAIAATNLLPGPSSTQLAIYCAWRLRGARGGAGLSSRRARRTLLLLLGLVLRERPAPELGVDTEALGIALVLLRPALVRLGVADRRAVEQRGEAIEADVPAGGVARGLLTFGVAESGRRSSSSGAGMSFITGSPPDVVRDRRGDRSSTRDRARATRRPPRAAARAGRTSAACRPA